MRQEPAIGSVYDFEAMSFGVLHADYWKVIEVRAHAQGRSVILRRCGDSLIRRYGLKAFCAAQSRGEFHPTP